MSETLPVQRWLAAIPKRRARRSFGASPISEDVLDSLDSLCRDFRPLGGIARVALVREAPQRLFMGIAGSYGGISGSPAALAFIGSEISPHAATAVGYTGEGIVLEATALGLDTCWVGGMFSAQHAALLGNVTDDERVYAVSPLGHAVSKISAKERVVFRMGRPKFRRDLQQIAPGSRDWPAWAVAGIEAARIAPSAMNRQPWRFRLEGGAIVISAEGGDTPRVSKRLDCGIAMLHFELGARGAGVEGEWVLLDAPDVARWTVAD